MAAPIDPVVALKASPLFAGFTDTGLTILAGITAPHNYPAGTPLFVENMVSDCMLIIVEGKVALTTKDPHGGGDLQLGELGPGDWLGELALISTGQRMCTATATSTVKALEIRQADFQKTLALKPQACIKLLMSIVTRFGQKVADNKDALRSLLKT
ncbi:MAG: cyclic nucleotide-binding domain-containing protein [Archangiaceae bacterium]|nr:cyclic nucleotide-binding domain-containing protein [Archangiaceae bacterium]